MSRYTTETIERLSKQVGQLEVLIESRDQQIKAMQEHINSLNTPAASFDPTNTENRREV